MSDFLVWGVHFAVGYVILFVSFLFYKEMTQPKPLTFLELFMYFEERVEKLESIVRVENEDTRKEMFEQYLRNKKNIKIDNRNE